MTEQTKRNIKIYVIFGVLFELMIAATRPYVAKFLIRLGGGSFDVALFNAMKGIFMIFVVLPGVYFVNKASNKMKVLATLIFMTAIVPFSFVIVAYLPVKIRPLSFIIFYSIMMIPFAIYMPSFQSFTGDLFPLYRAKVIAKRNMYVIVFNTIFTLIAGLVFKRFAVNNDGYIMIYQFIFLFSAISGLSAFFIFRKLHYYPNDNAQKEKDDFWLTLKNIPNNKPFLRFIVASTIFHFGWQMGWPLFSVYQIKYLGADELWLSIISISSAVVMFLGQRIWPKFIEKFGESRISTICTLGMAATPVIYAVSRTLPMMAVLASLTGVFTSGTITVLFADLLEVTPAKNRVVYMGFYNTMTNITLAISPFIGHFIHIKFSIYIALIVTAIFRAFGSIAFYTREKRELVS